MIVKAGSGYQSDWFVVLQFAGANLWSGKIDEHCNRTSELRCCGTRALDVDCFLFVRSVRHVDAHAVRARCDQLFDDFRLARSWTKSD